MFNIVVLLTASSLITVTANIGNEVGATFQQGQLQNIDQTSIYLGPEVQSNCSTIISNYCPPCSAETPARLFSYCVQATDDWKSDNVTLSLVSCACTDQAEFYFQTSEQAIQDQRQFVIRNYPKYNIFSFVYWFDNSDMTGLVETGTAYNMTNVSKVFAEYPALPQKDQWSTTVEAKPNCEQLQQQCQVECGGESQVSEFNCGLLNPIIIPQPIPTFRYRCLCQQNATAATINRFNSGRQLIPVERTIQMPIAVVSGDQNWVLSCGRLYLISVAVLVTYALMSLLQRNRHVNNNGAAELEKV